MSTASDLTASRAREGSEPVAARSTKIRSYLVRGTENLWCAATGRSACATERRQRADRRPVSPTRGPGSTPPSSSAPPSATPCQLPTAAARRKAGSARAGRHETDALTDLRSDLTVAFQLVAPPVPMVPTHAKSHFFGVRQDDPHGLRKQQNTSH